MIEKITNKMFGLSQLGTFVPHDKLNQTQSSNYILDNLEEIYYLIRTKTDEYCFTNRAFIHLDGSSDSKRNVLNRYDYSNYLIQDILLETAGVMDLDSELKFRLFPVADLDKPKSEQYLPLKLKMPNLNKNHDFMISVHRKDSEQLKALYKTLWIIGKKQAENVEDSKSSEKALNKAFDSLLAGKAEANSQDFGEITSFAEKWLTERKKNFSNEDFREIFEDNLHQEK